MSVNSQITWVTSFYDLAKIESNYNRRSKEEYLCYGDYILKMDINLYIFVAPEDVKYFIQKRKEYQLEHKTIVIGQDFKHLPYYKYKNIMTAAWSKNTPVFPHKLSVYYSMLMWCKTEFIGRTMVDNIFNSQYFGWIDFGLAHFTGTSFVPNLNVDYTDKIKMMQINYFSPKTIDFNKYGKRHYCLILDHIAGTLFSGRADYIEQYILLFTNKVLTALNDNYVPTDEPLIPLIIMEHPELFNLYYGDFKNLLSNYSETQFEKSNHDFGKDKIFNLLNTSKAEDNHEKVFSAAKQLLSFNKFDILTVNELEKVLDYYYIAAFYYEQSSAKSIGEMYKYQVENNNEFAKIYLTKKENIDSNLSFSGIKILLHTDYGLSKIPNDNHDLSRLMKERFEEFVALQKIANRITGCGSYLFDGNTSLDYYPQQYPKQKLLFEHSKNKTNILEIGTYASHSMWLMILANLDNHNFHYTGIDICYYDFTEPCAKYLQERYPGKITFINSDSVDALKQLDLSSYDLIHIDGGHDEIVVKETKYILDSVKPKTTLIFDDYDHSGPQAAFRLYGDRMEILTIANCPYGNCIAFAL